MKQDGIVVLDESSTMGQEMTKFIGVIGEYFASSGLSNDMRLMLMFHAWMINFVATFPHELDENVVDLTRELLAGYRLAYNSHIDPAQPN